MRRHWTLVVIIGSFDPPFPQNAVVTADHDEAVVNAAILDGFAGKNPFGVRRGSHQGGEECSRGATPLQSAIVLTVQKVTPARHRKDPSCGVIDGQNRSLQIPW